MPEPTYELSTYRSLPIPDYLAPPGVHITHDDKGGHIVFESELNPISVLNENYLDNVGRFLLSSYPEELNNKPDELYSLSEIYSENLCASFMEIQMLYKQQAGLIANGHWDDAQNMNELDKPFSIPRHIESLSLKWVLLNHLSKKFTKIHPTYHRMSIAEENSSMDLSEVEPGHLKVEPRDKESFEMILANAKLKADMETAMENFSEKELLHLFLLPDEEKRDQSISLVPSILTKNQASNT